jgi:putative PIN family toxin of toxin-antitoxin system
MIRAVLDANVLVRPAINPTGTPARLVALWRAARFVVVVSDALMREIYEVLHYPKILVRHGWSEAQMRAFLGELAHDAIRTPGALTLTVIQDDPADNRYLECAVEGAAHFLVTGDRLLLNLGAYQGVTIVTPRAFLEVLQSSLP